MTIKELQEKLDKNNTEYGTSFSLGGSYGNCELWAKDKNGGDNRLEAGSVDDCYNTWVKYRFNEKYKVASIERKGSMKKVSDYQGWKNFETWAVALHLSNDRNLSEMVKAWVKGAKEDAPNASQVTDGIWTVDETTKFKVADQIKDFLEEQNPIASDNSVYTDILQSALSEVNYVEIAEELIAAE